MPTFASLTRAVILLAQTTCVLAAPPYDAANRLPGISAANLEQGGPFSSHLFAAATQPAEPAQPAPDRTPAGEVQRARELLLRHSTIQARVVESVAVFDRKYTAEGEYRQQALRPNDWHMRLNLVLKVGDAEGSLLEVCDGDVLWTSTQISTGKKAAGTERTEHTVTRRNINQILTAAQKAGGQYETSVVASLGLGGLPGLLAGFERDIKLTEMKDDTLHNRPVVVVHGVWADHFLAKFGAQPGGTGSVALPPVVPDAARLYLDRENGFPLRILFLKRMEGRTQMRSMLTLDFLDVSLDQPLDKSEFAYTPPPTVTPVELTNFYLDQIAAIQAAAAAPQGKPTP